MTERDARSKTIRARLWIFLIPLVIVVLDQMLKTLMTGWLGPRAQFHRYDVIGSFAGFRYLENRGAAFGILPGQTGFLTIIALVIVVFAIGVMWRQALASPLTSVAIGMIVGGAVGNIIDRVRLGYVVDFIAIGSYPKFNLADSMVTIGVILLLWASFREEMTPDRKEIHEEQHG